MIKNLEPLCSLEALDYLKKSETENPDLIGFIKKFTDEKIKFKEIQEKIQELNFLKVKETEMVKIIDLMPETAEDLNKIFTDVSLDENETKQILEIVKEFK